MCGARCRHMHKKFKAGLLSIQLYYYENGVAYLYMLFAKRKKKRAIVSDQRNKHDRNISYP